MIGLGLAELFLVGNLLLFGSVPGVVAGSSSLALVVLSVAPPGQVPVVVPGELAGKWVAYSEESEDSNGEPEPGWSVELVLRGDSFYRTGYPPWEERATISTLERSENTYRLTLVDHVANGEKEEGQTVVLVLSADRKQLTYGRFALSREGP